VEGHDAVYKLNLLLVHAFGLFVHPADIFRLGINRIGSAEQAYAREKGYKIKLVARAIKEGDTVQAYVMPEFVRPQNKLYNVDGVFNGVRLNSCFSDAQFFEGRGAGAHPTASAVISDISALSYNYAYEYKKLGTHLLAAKEHDIYVEVFFRHAPANAARIRRAFDEIHTTHQEQDVQYLTGVISLGALRGLLDHDHSCSSILLQHKKNYVATNVLQDEIAFID
jgi:homoserine dehydrogenase